MTLPSRIGCIALIPLMLLAGCASNRWYDNPPPMPVPVSPTPKAALGPNPQVTFTWKPSDTATGYDFHIFNSENSDIDRYMKRNLAPGDVCRDGLCTLSLALSLPESERHAWRVRAVNNAGASSWTRNLMTWVGP